MKIENLRDLLPKNKFDTSNIEKLMLLSEKELKEILPELIYWIADFNWPVASKLIPVLVKYPNSIVPVIKNTLSLQEKDAELKYFIILELIPRLHLEYQKELIEDIDRIAKKPTEEELYAETTDEALVLLKKLEQ